MRNTTKLKEILLHYSLGVDMEKDLIRITLVHKENPDLMFTAEGKNWSQVIARAYSIAKKHQVAD